MKDSSIQFKVASMPDADNFQLGIYALLNQQEREQISTRTKAALKAAKARGVKLGNPKNLVQFNQERKRKALGVRTPDDVAQKLIQEEFKRRGY